MNESTIVLKSLRDELAAEDSGVVGRVELAGDTLSLMDGRIRVSVKLLNDPGSDPRVAHCHVLTKLGEEKWGEINACVIGLNDDRGLALKEVGHRWKEQVVAPILSLLQARPVMDAAHFDGSQALGVSGCHGFVGRMVFRGFRTDFDHTVLFDRPVFDYVAELAPPGLVHLAKVTLVADGKGGWKRNIEIDGHRVSYEDNPWMAGPPAPAEGIISLFALFHYADQPRAIEERQNLDYAILGFVSKMETEQTPSVAAKVLTDEGVEPDLAHRVAAFAPLAFGRIPLADMGVMLSREYTSVGPSGTVVEGRQLMHEAAFARSLALGRQLAATDQKEFFWRVAAASAELQVVNDALKKGSKPQNLSLFPNVIPERGTTNEAFQRALQQTTRRAANASAEIKNKNTPKPWWRLW